MIEIIETKNVYSDGSVRATIMSDTSAELTGVTSVDGTKLRFGSLALVAKEDVVCKLASNGVWYKSGISLEDVTVTPSTSQQTITAGEGYDGIGTVTVEAGNAVLTSFVDAYEDEEEQTVFNFSNNDDYRWLLKSITIPDGVLAIGEGSFNNCVSLETVVIPDSVTSIEERAFYNCLNLKNINIPNGITIINEDCFTSCEALESISIPNSVTEISKGAFDSCYSLVNISIPDSVTSIGYGAFMTCTSLVDIYIPASVTTIAEDVFLECDNLEQITINKPENSISGAPWGAPNATVTWTG